MIKIKVKKCVGCQFCNTSISGKGGISTPHREYGGRIDRSCNLQDDGKSYWSKDNDYSEMFKNCPLKEAPVTVELI